MGDTVCTANKAPTFRRYEQEIRAAEVLLQSLRRQFQVAVPFSTQWHRLRRDIRVAHRELQAMQTARAKMRRWPGCRM